MDNSEENCLQSPFWRRKTTTRVSFDQISYPPTLGGSLVTLVFEMGSLWDYRGHFLQLVTPHIRRHPRAKTLIYTAPCSVQFTPTSSTSFSTLRGSPPQIVQRSCVLPKLNLTCWVRAAAQAGGGKMWIILPVLFVELGPDFCPRGKSDKISPRLGTKVWPAHSLTGMQTTNNFCRLRYT